MCVVKKRLKEDFKNMSLLDKEGRNTSSNDPKMLDSRVFIGNLPSEKVSRQEIETMFAAYGTVLGVSLHKSYGFVQFDNEESAKKSAKAIHGTNLQGSTLGKSGSWWALNRTLVLVTNYNKGVSLPLTLLCDSH